MQPGTVRSPLSSAWASGLHVQLTCHYTLPSGTFTPLLCSEAFLTHVTAAACPCHLECWKNKQTQPGEGPPSHTMLLPRPSFPLAQSHPLTGACSSLISLLNGPPFPFLAPCSSLHPPASHLKSQESSICCEPPNLRETALSFAHAGLAAPPRLARRHLPARGPLTVRPWRCLLHAAPIVSPRLPAAPAILGPRSLCCCFSVRLWAPGFPGSSALDPPQSRPTPHSPQLRHQPL